MFWRRPGVRSPLRALSRPATSARCGSACAADGWWSAGLAALLAAGRLVLPRIGQELFPEVDSSEFTLHMRLKGGPRVETTESASPRSSASSAKATPSAEGQGPRDPEVTSRRRLHIVGGYKEKFPPSCRPRTCADAGQHGHLVALVGDLHAEQRAARRLHPRAASQRLRRPAHADLAYVERLREAAGRALPRRRFLLRDGRHDPPAS